MSRQEENHSSAEGLHVEDKVKGTYVKDKSDGLHIEDKEEGLALGDEAEDLPVKEKSVGLNIDQEEVGFDVCNEAERLRVDVKEIGIHVENKAVCLHVQAKADGFHVEAKAGDVPLEDKGEIPQADIEAEGLLVDSEAESLHVEDKSVGLHKEVKSVGLYVEDMTEGLHTDNEAAGLHLEDLENDPENLIPHTILKNVEAVILEKSKQMKQEFDEKIQKLGDDLLTTIHTSLDFTKQKGVRSIVKESETTEEVIKGGLSYWRKTANDELKSARQTELKYLTGMHTTLCIDVSDSMRHNDAWEQAKIFLTEYMSGLRGEFKQKRKHNTALVTFGHDTKVQQHLTKDLRTLEHALENITLGGPSPLLAGLILAKASATVSKYHYENGKYMPIPPRIIVVTDGKATDVDDVNELCFQDQRERSYEVKQLIMKEVSDIKKEEIEIHFVYVGNPDIVFLHKLREISGGELIPHTSGRMIAKHIIFKCLLMYDQELLQKADLQKRKKEKAKAKKQKKKVNSDKKREMVVALVDEDSWESVEEDLSSSDSSDDDSKKETKLVMEHCKKLFGSKEFDFSAYFDVMKKMFESKDASIICYEIFQKTFDTLAGSKRFDISDYTDIVNKLLESEDGSERVKTMHKFFQRMRHDVYEEDHDMQKYAPIGSRVRRGLDWRWGNQDNGGPGTIIGHSRDERNMCWCWVEWDAHANVNIYRWHINGPCDLTIVEEDRIPVDGRIFDVGSRVKPGNGYKGDHTHEEGIVIKLCNEKKVQVRWKDNGTKEELSFGEDCTSSEAEPVPLYLKYKRETEFASQISDSEGMAGEANLELLAPKDIEVYDVYEHTACLKWQKSIKDADFSNEIYVVTYGETKNPKKRTTIEVTAGLSCTLDDLKAGSEYTAEVKSVVGESESLPARCYSFTTMETDKDDSHYAGWPLTEQYVARLTSAIGDHWEMLGPELGIGHIPIRHIKTDNQTSISCIYQMLLRWIHQDPNPTFGKLINSLKKLPEVSVDRTVIDSMKQELRLMEMEMEKNKKNK